ncbi:MAG: RNA polymerase sigma factor [Chloroflexota bacterium]
MRTPSAADRARFEEAFEDHHRRVLAYALRRTAGEVDAEDVVAETFAIAWRRKDALPTTARALPWLLAVARRVAASQRRGTTRRRKPIADNRSADLIWWILLHIDRSAGCPVRRGRDARIRGPSASPLKAYF